MKNKVDIAAPQKSSFIKRAWKDPVGSKVISFGIITVSTLAYPTIKSFFTDESFLDNVRKVVFTQVPVGIILMALVFLLGLRWLYEKIGSSQKVTRAEYMYELKVMNVQFGDLISTLKSHSVPLPKEKMTETMNSMDLLSGFLIYARKYSHGVRETNGDLFLSHTLGGLLHCYGLLTTEPDSHSNGHVIHKLSPEGIEFYKICLCRKRTTSCYDGTRIKIGEKRGDRNNFGMVVAK
jgi:hypothetical protein